MMATMGNAHKVATLNNIFLLLYVQHATPGIYETSSNLHGYCINYKQFMSNLNEKVCKIGV